MSPHHLSMAEFVGSMPWLSFECCVILDRLLHSVKETVSLFLTDAYITSYDEDDLGRRKMLA